MTDALDGATTGSDGLAPLYRAALELEARGLDEAEMAARLHVEPEAVAAVLELAHRKVARPRE